MKSLLLLAAISMGWSSFAHAAAPQGEDEVPVLRAAFRALPDRSLARVCAAFPAARRLFSAAAPISSSRQISVMPLSRTCSMKRGSNTWNVTALARPCSLIVLVPAL